METVALSDTKGDAVDLEGGLTFPFQRSLPLTASPLSTTAITRSCWTGMKNLRQTVDLKYLEFSGNE
jgi:hypothetical protein